MTVMYVARRAVQRRKQKIGAMSLSKRDRRLLREILHYAEEVGEYLHNVKFQDFDRERIRRRAVEQVLILIGDRATRLTDETRKRIRQPWKELTRLRDKGVGSFEFLSPRTLFRISTETMPTLAKAIAAHIRPHQGLPKKGPAKASAKESVEASSGGGEAMTLEGKRAHLEKAAANIAKRKRELGDTQTFEAFWKQVKEERDRRPRHP